MSSIDLHPYSPEDTAPVDSNVVYLRLPPQSAEAEQAVLGGLLLDNAVWERVADLLRAEDLYAHRHKLIFRAIQELLDDTRPADVVTVFDRLKSRGEEEDAGGLPYLNSLAQYVPSAANARRYAEIVREKAILRRLISASEEIATAATNPGGESAAMVLDAAESRIFQIAEETSRMKQGFQPLDSLVVQLLDRVQEMADNPNDVTGVPTGFYDLDRMTAGLQAGDLVVLAARPSMGKTAFAINIAEHVALNEGLPVAVFSMEMGAAQLAVRIV
ncbi:MAG: replicative DNA helicase, partial [Burkholderiaceae bacterium]|nr:replicative DNA helicase [Burkholderiaceae bacterium]